MTLPSRPIFWMLLLSLVGCLSVSQLYADYRAKGTFLYEDREFGLGGFAETPTPRPIRFAEVRIMAKTIHRTRVFLRTFDLPVSTPPHVLGGVRDSATSVSC